MMDLKFSIILFSLRLMTFAAGCKKAILSVPLTVKMTTHQNEWVTTIGIIPDVETPWDLSLAISCVHRLSDGTFRSSERAKIILSRLSGGNLEVKVVPETLSDAHHQTSGLRLRRTFPSDAIKAGEVNYVQIWAHDFGIEFDIMTSEYGLLKWVERMSTFDADKPDLKDSSGLLQVRSIQNAENFEVVFDCGNGHNLKGYSATAKCVCKCPSSTSPSEALSTNKSSSTENQYCKCSQVIFSQAILVLVLLSVSLELGIACLTFWQIYHGAITLRRNS